MSGSWFDIIFQAADDFFEALNGNPLGNDQPGNMSVAAPAPAMAAPVAPAPAIPAPAIPAPAVPAPVVPAPAMAVPAAPAPAAPAVDRPAALRAACVQLEGVLERSLNSIEAMIPDNIRDAYGDRCRVGEHPLLAEEQRLYAAAGAAGADLDIVAEDINTLRDHARTLSTSVDNAESHLVKISAMFRQFQVELVGAGHHETLFKLLGQAWSDGGSAVRNFFADLNNFSRTIQSAAIIENKEMQTLRETSPGKAAEMLAKMLNAGMVRVNFEGPKFFKSDQDTIRDRFGGSWSLAPNSISGKLQWINAWELHIHGSATRTPEGDIDGFEVIVAHIKPSKRAMELGVSIKVENQAVLRDLELHGNRSFTAWASRGENAKILGTGPGPSRK